MTLGKALLTVGRILAVCLVFAVCFSAGVSLSGLSKVGQQAHSATNAVQGTRSPEQPSTARPPQAESLLPAFLTFSICVGSVLSYFILRSNWHGWLLVGAIAVGMYGISTVAAQVESVFFLSNKLPAGMIRAIFIQGGITTALFSPLAVLLLSKWRADSHSSSRASAGMSARFIAWRLALIVGAFVFLYMFFGYYVAWQNPVVREYYGGPEQPSFFAALKTNWTYHPAIYPLQVFRALLHVACLFPLIRMLRAKRWETAIAMALFLSAWTTVLLLPNPVMPSSVAQSHFRETLGFSLVFGALVGWLLSAPQQPVVKDSAV